MNTLDHTQDRVSGLNLDGLVEGRPETEQAVLARAVQVAREAHHGQQRASGEPYYLHALAVMEILLGLNLDTDTLVAAILHDVVEDSEVSLGDIRAEFGDAIATMVDGVTKMERIGEFQQAGLDSSNQQQAESLRKLLLAMAEDVRVVLIKLADRLHNMRTLGHLEPDKQRRIAQETLEIYAPLANRLGIWQIKWELEDLALRYLEPEVYQSLVRQLAERRVDREKYIQRVIDTLHDEMDRAGIQADIAGRPKHINSIWRKMQRKHLDFDQIFDVRAVRILVDSEKDCYAALGVVHGLWRHIPKEFDDYIANPKENLYRSLHTAVLGPEGRTLEVQIRTHDMHRHAELGVAAHWRYKEGGPNDPAFDNKIAVMRQLLDTAEEELDDESLLESFQAATSEDRVYALTPKGQVVDMVAGATVLDFAYNIHTEVGHRCRGAKINGRIVPLTQQVQTGDRVEILTGKQPRPSRDWLNPRLGYIRGARGRAKVRQWFRKESYDENLSEGRDLVEAELKRMGMKNSDLEGVAGRFSLNRLTDVFVAVGCGDLTVSQVVHAAERLRADREEPTAEDLVTWAPRRSRGESRQEADDIRIEGVGNLMTSMARCCQPVPGDPVVGYVTRGRGVTIHREDCSNVLRWQVEENPRLLQVHWGQAPTSNYPVELLIRAFDRRDLIKDISATLAASEVNVTDISSRLDETRDEVSIRLHARVRNYEQLSELLNRLASIRNVLEARRLQERSG